MRYLILIALGLFCSCREQAGSVKPNPTNELGARRTFSQFDQIAAVGNARPTRDGFKYELTIRNLGSEPLVGYKEALQQWQAIEEDPRDLETWNEHIPQATDGDGMLKLEPNEEYRCEVEPVFQSGVRLRFGFVVLCQVGDDPRRLRVWSEVREPDDDFKGR